MKIRRHKHTKRMIKYYKTNFNLDTKIFNVLIDGTFAHEALKTRINIAEQMPRFFDVKESNCKLFTTKCAVRETELLGKPTHGAMLILKQYKLVECQHKGQYVNTEQCFKSVLNGSTKTSSGHEMRFFVATQSDSMKEIVRSTPGVPLMFISHNAINVEKPSEASVDKTKKILEKKLLPRELEMESLKKLKSQLLENGPNAGKVVKTHKKKRAKGPNPLSCKKKTTKTDTNKKTNKKDAS